MSLKYIFAVLLLVMFSFNAAESQSVWKDMGAYKETTDTTGVISQMKVTSDGKYIYTITTLTEQNKKNVYLQKWDIDKGTIIFSRLIDLHIYSAVYNIALNCDASSYSLCVALTSGSNSTVLVVKDNDTDSLLLSCIDKGGASAKNIKQMDYDRVLQCFYVAYYSYYYKSNGADVTQYSNGTIRKKSISGDSIIEHDIIGSNTDNFTHRIGMEVIASISNYNFQESKNRTNTTTNTNFINYVGFTGTGQINLARYDLSPQYHYDQIALSPNGSVVAATNESSYTVWYIDSTLRYNQLGYFTTYTNCFSFSGNSYLIANSPNDSTIKTINVGMGKVCGIIKHPVFERINRLVAVPHSNYSIAGCIDGKFRLIPSLIDTLQASYSFTYNKTSIYQHDSISFCAVIPSLDSSSIEWNFGDGKASASVNPRHRFDTPGLYDITMKVTDNTGEHTIREKQLVEVKITPNPITLDFETDVRYGNAPLTVHFTSKCTGTIASYKWDFGDGTTSGAKDTLHTFTGQRPYTITLTINNGIKDTSITRLHYINADEYPSYVLSTKLIQRLAGQQSVVYYNTETFTNVFETMVRSNLGKTYLKQIRYHHLEGINDMQPFYLCGSQTTISRLQKTGTDKNIIKTATNISSVFNKYCEEGNGVLGVLNNNLLSYFVLDNTLKYPVGEYSTYVLNEDGITKHSLFPFFTMYYTVSTLRGSIDCYSFRSDRGLLSDSSYVCFYRDTTTLLAKDAVKGYVLPAVETNANKFLSVVSPLRGDSVASKQLQLRWYGTGGTFIDSMFISRPYSDFIVDIIRIPNNKYMLCGNSTTSVNDDNGNISSTVSGLILIMDEKGSIEYTKYLPQWSTLKRITRMDDETYAISGTPRIGYPGFIAVKSTGAIVGAFHGDIQRGRSNAFAGYDVSACQTCVDVSFGSTMNTVFFTRNDGNDAELYASDNPYLKDIQVSVEEDNHSEIPGESGILLSPNPTDGATMMEYYSPSSQLVTITIASTLGEIVYKQDVMVESGKNHIPIDISDLNSGVAFVSVSDATSIRYGQIHIIK